MESELAVVGTESSKPMAQHHGPRSGLPLADTVTFSAPLDTLARDEIRRTRRYCYASFTMSLVGLAAMPALGGGRGVTVLLVVAIVIAVLGAAFLLYQTRDMVRFQQPVTVVG